MILERFGQRLAAQYCTKGWREQGNLSRGELWPGVSPDFSASGNERELSICWLFVLSIVGVALWLV
jgi:hypothetical protein